MHSSSLSTTNCTFSWIGWTPLFLVNEGTDLGKSSVTIISCRLVSSSNRVVPLVNNVLSHAIGTQISVSIVATSLSNKEIIGPDGLAQKQTKNDRFSPSADRVATTLLHVAFSNVSSSPHSVPLMEGNLRQSMLGCSVSRCNNHLSGSTLRDMNGGGDFLSSNCTFSDCHTYSHERPSVIENSKANAEDPYTNQVYDGVEDGSTRFLVEGITITNCSFSNMHYTVTSTYSYNLGGSCIYTTRRTANLIIDTCSFSTCSVSHNTASQVIYAGCILLYSSSSASPRIKSKITSCSFQDWYPGNPSMSKHVGGAVGGYTIKTGLEVINSNLTLTGSKAQTWNGGFIAYYYSNFESYPLTITNCQLKGDGSSTGQCITYTNNRVLQSLTLSITDTSILDTNSDIAFNSACSPSPFTMTRTHMRNAAINFQSVKSTLYPALIVDCLLEQTNLNLAVCEIAMFVSGTVFNGTRTPNSAPSIMLSSSRPAVFHGCTFSDITTNGNGLIVMSDSGSLTLDTISFTKCSGTKAAGVFHIMRTSLFASFCTFDDITGKTANILFVDQNCSSLFENCVFNLPNSDVADIRFSSSSTSILNGSSVIGCVSNRTLTTTEDGKTLSNWLLVTTPEGSSPNKMKVGVWSDDQEQSPEIHPTLSDAFDHLLSTIPNSMLISDGSFEENSALQVSVVIEIVGNGTEAFSCHMTRLKTDGFSVLGNGQLTVRSILLVPSTPNSVLFSMSADEVMELKSVTCQDLSGQTSNLVFLTAGQTRIVSSVFNNTQSSEALIAVTGSASLTLSDTLFVRVNRTSLKPTPVATTQCASCVQTQTSGAVAIVYSRFGGCISNGRAGAIDIASLNPSSTVMMEWCRFERNKAGSGVDNEEKGDDGIIIGFLGSQCDLRFGTFESIPSVHHFLVDSTRPFVPAPPSLQFMLYGLNQYLAWIDLKCLGSELLTNTTLTFLLGERLHNNIHTTITTNFVYSETISPFLFRNGSTSIKLTSGSSLNVEQTSEIFCQLVNASLSLENIRLLFQQLENIAFLVDEDSSLSLSLLNVSWASQPLTHPFISSTGHSVTVDRTNFTSTLQVIDVPFIKATRQIRDGTFFFNQAGTLAISFSSQPFFDVQGMSSATISNTKFSSTSNTTAPFIRVSDSSLIISSLSGTSFNSSTDGSVLAAESSTISITYGTFSQCSAQNGGAISCLLSNITINGVTFSKCSAQNGGALHLSSCNLTFQGCTFSECTALNGGAISIDLSDSNCIQQQTTTVTLFSGCSATAELESQLVGKGGAIHVRGQCSSATPIAINSFRFEKNTAGFGNDVFVDLEVIDGKGVDCLQYCGGESYSAWPHLEVEGTSDETERDRISAFLKFPIIEIRQVGYDSDSCKWSNAQCRTLGYSLQFLRATFLDGSLYTRIGRYLDQSVVTECITLNDQHVSLTSTPTPITTLTLPNTLIDDCSMFTINDCSHLTIQRLCFSLKPHHRVIDVSSAEGWIEMKTCQIIHESGATISFSPIHSVGNHLSLYVVTFNSSVKSAPPTFSVPLVKFAPTPSEAGQLGNGSFEMTHCSFIDLSFSNTPPIVLETKGTVAFSSPSFTNVTNGLSNGQVLSLNGSSFKQQIDPDLWTKSYSASDPTALLGEDSSMEWGHKWRTSSLVYWLISPKTEVILDRTDMAAHDHPNCGSSEFKCDILESSFTSASLNSINIISLASSTSLNSPLVLEESYVIKSSSPIQEIQMDEFGSVELNNLTATLAFSSLKITIKSTCSSAAVFVVSNGLLELSSCTIGPSDPLSAILSPSTISLIEVKESGRLNLVGSSLSNLAFTHNTLGTAIHLKKRSTFTFTPTSSPFSSITSNGTGSLILIEVENDDEITEAELKFKSWAPTKTEVRFTLEEKNMFVAKRANGSFDKLIYAWYPYDYKTLHVFPDGDTHAKCGLAVLPCSSLSDGLSKVGDGRLVVVDGDIIQLDTLSFDARATTIQSPDSAIHQLSVSHDASVVSKSNNLSFLRLSFVPLGLSSRSNEDTNGRDQSLFTVVSGSLSLSDCSLSSFVLLSCPLIAHTTGSLSLQSCTVDSIIRSQERGSLLATSMKQDMRLTIDDLTFSSMSSSPDSVAILLSFSAIETPSFALTKLNYGQPAEPTARFVEIVGKDISKWITVNDSAFADSYTKKTDLNYLWSIDEEFDLSASLLFYLLPHAGPVGVERDGYRIDRCGYSTVWCPTIDQSLLRMEEQNTTEMEVMGNVDLTSSTVLTRPLQIRGGVSVSTIHVLSDGSILSSLHHTLTAEYLFISLPDTHNPDAVFVSSSDIIKLNSLTVSSTAPSNAMLVQILGGQAELVRLTLNAGLKENTELIQIAAGEVDVSFISVTSSLDNNQTIIRMKDGRLRLTNFTLATSETVDGRFLDLSGESVAVSNITLAHHTFSSAPFVFSSVGSTSLVEIHTKNCTTSHLVVATDCDDVSLRQCSFSSVTTHNSVDDTSQLCSWDDSLLYFQNCATHLHFTEMTYLHQGAITTLGGSLTITSCTFSSNIHHSTLFPSLRHNVDCHDGNVTIVSVASGDGDQSSPHHWIASTNCTVEKASDVLPAPFFTPTLISADSKSVFNKTRKEYDVIMKGAVLVPCGLTLEIFEHIAVSKTSFLEGNHVELPFDLENKTWNETTILFALPIDSFSDLNTKHDIRCRLLYGSGEHTDSFSLTRGSTDKMSQAAQTVMIVVPIACAAIFALLVILIILLVLRRRNKKKQETVEKRELDDAPAFQDEMKYEVLDHLTTARPLIHASTEGAPQNQSMLAVSHANSHELNSTSGAQQRTQIQNQITAMQCEGDNAEVIVNRADTLYRALHVEKKLDLNKAVVRRQLISGLEKVVKEHPNSELITRLSPHWILLDQCGTVCLKIDIEQNTFQNATKQSEEDRRWDAPEQESKENNESAVVSNPLKASVFRLGLVLWELETELVPFGELDAINASRQVKAGMTPLIHNWDDTEMAELVKDCLSFDPNDRPSLSDVKSRLNLQTVKSPIPALPQQNDVAVISRATG
ncbi:hypothetical protein BLNAU_39 [Blattamonas nauphoetae]|uniref:Protein kinase domain-containing protein n=1 Tax=Blattamonas nauphoetae TaxID=2049346 RepID=A0ABQ9YLU7_9EUKA|nr:hypothetical protein BLNAU_39 [Blattamonas nauphoetae]